MKNFLREQRRQRLLKETPDEKESPLAKCREAFKKRTAEAKGKQKKYMRVYTGTECCEERETCLANEMRLKVNKTTIRENMIQVNAE